MGRCTASGAETISTMQSWTRSAEKWSNSWHTSSTTVRGIMMMGLALGEGHKQYRGEGYHDDGLGFGGRVTSSTTVRGTTMIE